MLSEKKFMNETKNHNPPFKLNGWSLKLLSNFGNRFSRRNNSNKIVQQRFKTSLRKNSFAVRVAKVSNKLPDQVINAPSTNAFKNRLHKYWENEELYYSDYMAEISGGNKSDIQLPNIDTIGESGEVAPREEPVLETTVK